MERTKSKGIILIMQRFILILSVFFLLLGCSTQASKPADIREELYNDSVEVINLYSDFIENGKGSFEEISRKWVYYTNKYSQVSDMTETEKELLQRMSFLSIKLNKYDTAYQSGDIEKTKEQLNLFTVDKTQIEEILKLK